MQRINGKASVPQEGGLREVLVREGRLIFEENGPKELSLRELARRVGVSEAAPFKHFSGKDELLSAIAASGFRQLAAERKVIAAAEPEPFRRAQQMMLSYVRFARMNEGLFDMMIGPRLQGFRDGELGVAGAESYGLFSDAIQDLARSSGWPDESLDLISDAAWSLEHGVAALILAGLIPREGSAASVESIVEFSVNLQLRAVEAGPAASGLAPRDARPPTRGGARAKAAS